MGIQYVNKSVRKCKKIPTTQSKLCKNIIHFIELSADKYPLQCLTNMLMLSKTIHFDVGKRVVWNTARHLKLF